MGLETGTFISDLTTTNPISTDVRSQGDDHLRLLKTCIKGSFPTSSKAWYNPTTSAKSALFTIVAADMNKTFLVTTTAGLITVTLPSLVAGDAGWECFLMKVSFDANPMRIVPAAGTLQSGDCNALSSARRCIPNNKISCYWTGAAWIIGRTVSVPVGTCIEFHGSGLPYGYEWPNGQTLASASTNYAEHNALCGTTLLDKRGRYAAGLDNLGGSAAGRITTAGGGIDGATATAVGGLQAVVIVTANLPSYTPTGSVAVTDGPISVSQNASAANFTTTGGGGFACGGSTASISASQSGTTAVFTGVNNGGISTGVKTLPPTIMVRQVVAVE